MKYAGRYYERHSQVPIDEDEHHEFKGHRSISIEDLPPWCYQPGSQKRSRKAVSRAIAAFLNSARGGTIYLGVIDEGIVKGLYLTKYQQHHVLVSIKDLFSRYQPPVSANMYKIEFIPVFGKDEEHILEESEIYELSECDIEKRLRPHLLRTYDFCWCDQDLARRIDEGDLPHDYVIEVVVYPQEPSFRLLDNGSFHAVLPVVYRNEEEKCFFRKSASCVEYTLDAITELAEQQLKELYDPIVTGLRSELDEMLKVVDDTT